MSNTEDGDDWDRYVEHQNNVRAKFNLLRVPRVLQPSVSGVRVCVSLPSHGSHDLTLFSTNDYLGLSSHPEVRAAIAGAAASYGMGPRSAAIVAGHTSLHERLECRLAQLKHTEACLLFPTGFAANLAVITALAMDSSVAIFSDELNHASLIDGCRLARARGVQTHIFRHKDYDHLHHLLEEHRRTPRKLIVTDGVFSMDGDVADLKVRLLALLVQSLAGSSKLPEDLIVEVSPHRSGRSAVLPLISWAHGPHVKNVPPTEQVELRRLRMQHNFLLLVDDAHGTLVLGTNGGGVADMKDLRGSVDVHVGTLSKAVGAHGGFVACSHAVKKLLVNQGRAYVYSTALPVPTVAAAVAALDVFQRERWRMAHLGNLQQEVSRYVGKPVHTPIVPILVGSPETAMLICEQLLEEGFHVPAIRPPTVPSGTSRLRLSLSAEHTVAEVLSLLSCIDRQVRALKTV